jgi:large subunit ribosomal protein L33
MKKCSRLVAMSQDQLIKIQNKQTGEIYFTRKNRKKVERKVELKKYSKKLRKHIKFVEIKK